MMILSVSMFCMVMVFNLVLGGLSVLYGNFERVVGFVCAIKYHSLEKLH